MWSWRQYHGDSHLDEYDHSNTPATLFHSLYFSQFFFQQFYYSLGHLQIFHKQTNLNRTISPSTVWISILYQLGSTHSIINMSNIEYICLFCIWNNDQYNFTKTKGIYRKFEFLINIGTTYSLLGKVDFILQVLKNIQ